MTGSPPADIDERADRLVAEIAASCRDLGLTVAVVESLTSGALATALGRGESAAEWFRGGVVAYQTAVKESVLQMTPGLDPCTSECAAQLAAHGRSLLDADVCVSLTGVGGPEPADGHPAGEVHVGSATAGATRTVGYRFAGSPQEVVDQSTMAGLSAVRDALRQR